MNEQEARRVLAEAARRGERLKKFDPAKILFPVQLNFVLDQSKRKAAVCSRRAGKSFSIAVMLILAALKHQDAHCPYITLTRMQGKRILWPALRKLDRTYDLGMKFNLQELSATLPNGSTIFICGANDESEIERLRGIAVPIAVIDEAQAFRPFIRKLIHDILDACTMDLDGQIVLTGTPNAGCVGLFYEATTGDVPQGEKDEFASEEGSENAAGWSVHHWTVLQNCHLGPDPDYPRRWLAEYKRRNRWTDDHPTYRREWLGEWVRDENALVYKLKHYSIVDKLPEAPDLEYILGVDFGFVDATAYSILAFSELLAEVYVVETLKEEGQIPSAIAARIDKLNRQYDFVSMVGDPGGGGKFVIEEANTRFGLSMQVAEKSGKNAFIDLLNGDLAAGTFKVLRHCTELIEEVALLQWKDHPDDVLDQDGRVKRNDRRIPDPRYADHVCDATLYAYREARHFLHENIENLPLEGSKEWWDKEEQRIEESLEAELEPRDQNEFSEKDSWLVKRFGLGNPF